MKKVGYLEIFLDRYVYKGRSSCLTDGRCIQAYVENTEIMEIRNRIRGSRILSKVLYDNRHGIRCLHQKYLVIVGDNQSKPGPERAHPSLEAAREIFKDILFPNGR